MGDTLDVRPAHDFPVGHFASAISCPLEELARSLHRLPPRDSPFWVFGEDDRVDQAIAMLRGRGFSAVEAHPAMAPGAAPSRPVSAAWIGDAARVRLWRPSPFLAETLRALRERIDLPALPDVPRALDVGCGSGRDATYLALAGFDVTGVDVLPDALERAAALASEAARATKAAGTALAGATSWIRADVERTWPFLANSFDVVVCMRFLWRSRLPDLAKALRPGGHLVYETFTRAQAVHGKPTSPEHLLEPDELRRAFETTLGLTVIHYEERDSETGPALASLWAIREYTGS